MKLYKFGVALLFYLFNAFVSRIPVYAIRHFYLRRVLGIRIGKQSSIHMSCFITGLHISVGDCSTISRKCHLDGRGGLTIGSYVSISPEVYTVSLTHDAQDPAFGLLSKPLVIEDYAWIGARTMIMPGVTIARGTVVGAQSVVTKSFPPYSIIAGVPAKLLGERNHNFAYSPVFFPYFDSDVAKPLV